MTIEEFYKEINGKRKAGKGKWYWFNGEVDGKQIQLKGFNTWLQIYKVNGIDYSGIMDIPVKKFNETLAAPFK